MLFTVEVGGWAGCGRVQEQPGGLKSWTWGLEPCLEAFPPVSPPPSTIPLFLSHDSLLSFRCSAHPVSVTWSLSRPKKTICIFSPPVVVVGLRAHDD